MRGKILLMVLVVSLILVVGCAVKEEVVEVNKPVIETETFTQIGKGNLYTDNVIGNVYPCMKQVEDKFYIEIRTVDESEVEKGVKFALLYGANEREDAKEQIEMSDDILCVINLAATDTEITEELYNGLLINNTYYLYEKIN